MTLSWLRRCFWYSQVSIQFLSDPIPNWAPLIICLPLGDRGIKVYLASSDRWKSWRLTAIFVEVAGLVPQVHALVSKDQTNENKKDRNESLGGAFKYLLFSILGKIPILTTSIETDWNHQLDLLVSSCDPPHFSKKQLQQPVWQKTGEDSPSDLYQEPKGLGAPPYAHPSELEALLQRANEILESSRRFKGTERWWKLWWTSAWPGRVKQTPRLFLGLGKKHQLLPFVRQTKQGL